MLRHSRPLALLLLVAFAATMCSGESSGMFVAREGHSAGCHDSRPMTPSPAQTNYQCCVNGHHWATASAAFSRDPGLAETRFEQGDADFALHAFLPSEAAPFPSSDSPPGMIPLRI